MKKFNQFIGEFKSGNLDEKLTEELNELTQAVQYHMMPGELTVKIKLKPAMDGEINTVVQFNCKPPKRDSMESIMFATPEGDLLASDPSQPTFFDKSNIKAVDDSPKEQITKTI